jgi:2-phosphoglycerate kinase
VGLDDSLAGRFLQQTEDTYRYELARMVTYIQNIESLSGYSAALATEQPIDLIESLEISNDIYTGAKHSDIDLSNVSIATWSSC